MDLRELEKQKNIFKMSLNKKSEPIAFELFD
jgi:hypothetical protein